MVFSTGLSVVASRGFEALFYDSAVIKQSKIAKPTVVSARAVDGFPMTAKDELVSM